VVEVDCSDSGGKRRVEAREVHEFNLGYKFELIEQELCQLMGA
jgi:hypothetical protein